MVLLYDDLRQCTYSGDKTGHRRSGDPGTNLPDPACLWAIPVLMTGKMPRSVTLRASIPAAVGAKLRAGSVNAGLPPRVMACIRRLLLVASAGVPPTNLTIAGDDAIAKPPTPAVSVIALSPSQQQRRQRQIREEQTFNGIGRSSNQRSPVPESRIPKFTPLRAITVTIELNGTLAAASIIALQAAIDRLRKK